MSTFTLKVTFTGLNLFIEDKDHDQVAVLQPDCLPDSTNPDKMKHDDETVGVPHVGFVSFDLANVGRVISDDCEHCPDLCARLDKLRGEGLFRFRGHTLDFGITKGDTVTIQAPFPLPDFGKFAPTLEVSSTMMPAPPPLMRTVLYGGTLEGSASQEWRMPQVLNTVQPAAYSGDFAKSVTWTRRLLPGTGLTLTIRDNTTAEVVEIPLTVAGNSTEIAIKIANVCSENPLGWEDFEYTGVLRADEDFKWLYRLLTPPAGKTYPQMLLGSPFPIPRPVPGGAGVENCIGGIMRGKDFTF